MNKRKQFIFRFIVILVILFLVTTSIVYGEDLIIRYKFSRIEKVYKNNIIKDGYLAEPIKRTKEDWLSDFVGGLDETFIIKVGQVIYDKSNENSEDFIELESNKDKITLIANGASYEYYNDTNQLKRKTLEFLPGKRLEDKDVVKDYSEKNPKVILVVEYDMGGNGTPLAIYCSDYPFNTLPKDNYYKLLEKH